MVVMAAEARVDEPAGPDASRRLQTIDELVTDHVYDVTVRHCRGNVSAASRILDCDRGTVKRYLDRYYLAHGK